MGPERELVLFRDRDGQKLLARRCSRPKDHQRRRFRNRSTRNMELRTLLPTEDTGCCCGDGGAESSGVDLVELWLRP